jgi:hypothetical protein
VCSATAKPGQRLPKSNRMLRPQKGSPPRVGADVTYGRRCRVFAVAGLFNRPRGKDDLAMQESSGVA